MFWARTKRNIRADIEKKFFTRGKKVVFFRAGASKSSFSVATRTAAFMMLHCILLGTTLNGRATPAKIEKTVREAAEESGIMRNPDQEDRDMEIVPH